MAHPSADRQFLTFYMGDQLFGIETKIIKEINDLETSSSTPSGQLLLRDTSLPLIDLRQALSLPEQNYSGKGCLIIIGKASRDLALRVDSIDTITQFPLLEIPLSPGLSAILGQVTYDKKNIILLNLAACLPAEFSAAIIDSFQAS